jgi:hypothetical protein
MGTNGSDYFSDGQISHLTVLYVAYYPRGMTAQQEEYLKVKTRMVANGSTKG